tara:strand:+ start:68 stop:418 length:351 start_codon:yes stop_codon:yes gene_type:complete
MNHIRNNTHFKVINSLADHPNITQRDLARLLGVSLGKVNYCIQALIKQGLIKIKNFKNSNNKLSYHYLFTPKGLEEKSRLTLEFLELKIKEHKKLVKEIKELEMICHELNIDVESE